MRDVRSYGARRASVADIDERCAQLVRAMRIAHDGAGAVRGPSGGRAVRGPPDGAETGGGQPVWADSIMRTRASGPDRVRWRWGTDAG